MTEKRSGQSLAIAARLADVEARAARGEWAAIRDSLADDAAVADNAELFAFRGEALLRLGEPREALAWLQPRLSHFSRQANHRAWRRTVNLAGAAAFELGLIDDAEEFFVTALDHATRVGDHLTGARALNNLALVASTRGEWPVAMNYYTMAMPAYERTGSVRGVAECSHNIAATLLEAGALDEAEEWERRAMELAQETGNERLRGFALGGRAEMSLRRQDWSLAIVLGEQAAATFRPLGDLSSEAHALRLVGQAKLGSGNLDEAWATLTRAIELAAQSKVLRVLAESRLARARCSLARRDTDRARPDLVAALEGFGILGAREKATAVEHLLVQVDSGAFGAEA
jgi:MalT-like TPR region